MHRATTMPARKVAYHDETETVQMRLYKSLKVWSMYADLEESFGTFKVCHYYIYNILVLSSFYYYILEYYLVFIILHIQYLII